MGYSFHPLHPPKKRSVLLNICGIIKIYCTSSDPSLQVSARYIPTSEFEYTHTIEFYFNAHTIQWLQKRFVHLDILQTIFCSNMSLDYI